MNCPECGAATSVIDSRPYQSGATIRRRRVCPMGHRATSYEMYKDENVQERIASIEGQIDALRMLAIASLDSQSSEVYRWRALCELLGAEQEKVALAAGVSPNYLSKTEHKPRPTIAQAIDQALRSLAFERLHPNQAGSFPEASL